MLALYIVSGFILLLIGGELLVRGSVGVAKKMGVSPLVIGIVLVGFGTSVPELVTCIEAALNGSPEIALGNVVGSNIANILLIVGASALMIPLVTPIKTYTRDFGAMIAASVLFIGASFLGMLNIMMGVVFWICLIGYIGATFYIEKRKPKAASTQMHEHEMDVFVDEDLEEKPLGVGLFITVGGIALTILGAKLLVAGAIGVAENFGISEAVIGLTIVALGTSLPELATAVIAGLKGESDVSLGNIIGSNIYNILCILGTTIIVHPLDVPEEMLRLDLWIMLGVSLLLILFAWTGNKIGRVEGGVLIALYIAYMGYLFMGSVV